MTSWKEINDKTNYFMREFTKLRLTRTNQAKTIQKCWRKYSKKI